MKLYGIDNPRTQKILCVSSLLNIQLEFVCLQFQDLQSPNFLQMSNLGKSPVLETPDGILLESNTIMKYIATGSPLAGNTEFKQAKVQQWLDFASTELESSFIQLLLSTLGVQQLSPSQSRKAQKTLNQLLKVIDGQLQKSYFLVGDSLTMADINLNTYLKYIFTFMVGHKERLLYPNVIKYHNHIQTIPIWIDHFGRTRYCKEPFPLQLQQEQQYYGQKYMQNSIKPITEKKRKQNKDEKEQQEQQKFKDPYKNQFDQPFQLDKWKKYFFASNDIDAEFQWLWANLDQTMWSIWEIVFEKSEIDALYLNKAINHVLGFLHWLSPVHFLAIHGVYGDEPDLQIRGAWLWRGTDIQYDLKNHPTFYFLKINKLDINDQTSRAKFEEYWLNQKLNESSVQGLTTRYVKCFK